MLSVLTKISDIVALVIHIYMYLVFDFKRNLFS